MDDKENNNLNAQQDNTPEPTEESPAGTAQTEQSSGEEPNTTSDDESTNEWENIFKGKSPEDVAKDLDEWKKHAREWEKRAKANKGKSDGEAQQKLDHVTTLLHEQATEVNMFRDLVALQFEREVPIAFADIADSIAFRTAYNKLNREADDFTDKLTELVEARSPKRSGTHHVEVNGTSNRGADLYDRLFKNS